MANATPNLGLQNFYSTTLAQAAGTTDTIFYLNGVLPTPAEGYLVIDLGNSNVEVIHYVSKGSNFVQLTDTTDRGQDGTSASAHGVGASVKMTVNAGYWTNIQNMKAVSAGAVGAIPFATGWTPISNVTPNSVTYNGNHSYNLGFNATDLTGFISNGMRLKLTRTVTAPTQCTSLNGTTQFYSKTTPNGMTFTNNFVVSAWVKLTSYAASSVISRYDGTSGFDWRIEATGQVSLNAYNGGAANSFQVLSYQSIPLNKWVHISAQMDMTATTNSPTVNYIMIDGVDVPALVGRGGTLPTALAQAGNLNIGARTGTVQFFPGKIAQVAIFSAKVTQATIQGYISQGLAGTETSLISAYSFNNSINDLNANANNLTANGSAVATNADSPFAQDDTGTPLGTTDCGIVTSKVFSTNTTLTVQVPEGCTIPTTGGVSALAYSTQKTPYGFPSSSGRWAIVSIYRTDVTKSTLVAGTWYNQNTQLSIPAGVWVAGYDGPFYGQRPASSFGPSYASLSTSTSAETDTNFKQASYHSSNVASIAQIAPMSKRLPLASPLSTLTTHYLLVKSDTADGVDGFRGDLSPLVIFAEPATF